MKQAIFAFWLLMIPLLGAGYNAEDITSVKYWYMGSSTPPRFHRSYVIVLTPTSVKMTVDSYGKVLAEKEDAITGVQFKKLVEVIQKNHLAKSDETDSKGCAGGTQEGITLLKEQQEIFSANVYHCGGKDFGDLKGDLEAVLQEMRKLIPEFEQLLATPYE